MECLRCCSSRTKAELRRPHNRSCIPPVALFVIVPMVICISALPITPSGLGVRENLFVLMLSEQSINVPQTSALSLSLLTLAGSLFWSLVGVVVYVTLKQRHHLTEKELVRSTG